MARTLEAKANLPRTWFFVLEAKVCPQGIHHWLLNKFCWHIASSRTVLATFVNSALWYRLPWPTHPIHRWAMDWQARAGSLFHGLLDNSSILSSVYYLGFLGWSVRSTGSEPVWRKRAAVTIGISYNLAIKIWELASSSLLPVPQYCHCEVLWVVDVSAAVTSQTK